MDVGCTGKTQFGIILGSLNLYLLGAYTKITILIPTSKVGSIRFSLNLGFVLEEQRSTIEIAKKTVTLH